MPGRTGKRASAANLCRCGRFAPGSKKGSVVIGGASPSDPKIRHSKEGCAPAIVCGMPSGAAVLFTTGPLGASREFDLGHLVEGEERRPGDRGRVLFDHPNPKLAAEGWGYVEVESRLTPGEKLYVGVAPSMIAGSRCCVFHATGGSRMMDCGPEVHEEEASAPPAGSSSPG